VRADRGRQARSGLQRPRYRVLAPELLPGKAVCFSWIACTSLAERRPKRHVAHPGIRHFEGPGLKKAVACPLRPAAARGVLPTPQADALAERSLGRRTAPAGETGGRANEAPAAATRGNAPQARR
jgi:hypothetical protein